MIPLDRLQPAPADRTVLSPNHSSRGDVDGIRLVVLHASADGGNERGTLDWLTDADSRASAHLLIGRDGTVTRLVPDTEKAWHAGTSEWRGIEDLNRVSLGWELANRNDGVEPYTDAQYRTLARLAAWYLPQGLTMGDFVSHAEVARPLGRKSDPAGFDWVRFKNAVEDWQATSPPAPLDVPIPDVLRPEIPAEIIPPGPSPVPVPRPSLTAMVLAEAQAQGVEEHALVDAANDLDPYLEGAERVALLLGREDIARGIHFLHGIIRALAGRSPGEER